MNNLPRFPIGDNGDEIELLEVLSNSCRCNRQSTCQNNCDHSYNNDKCTMPRFDDSVARAMVYSPDHEFDNMYDTDTALDRGTLFKLLDKPFGGVGISGGNCR